MNQTREELIARRDELIQELQGEWKTDRSWFSVDRRLWRSCLIWVITSLVGFYLPLALFLLVIPIQNQSPVYVQGMLALFGLSLGLVLVLIQYTVVHVHQMMIRRFGNMIVRGSELVRECADGYPSQRLHLERLGLPTRPGQEGPTGINRGIYALMRSLGVKSLDSSALHVFVAEGDHNTPSLRPVLIHDGDQLVRSLTELARMNKEITAMEQGERL